MGQIYEKYAEIYDATGQDEFGKRMLKDLHELLKETGLHPRTALDLACGTGTVAILLAQEGIEVWGVDASEKMLSMARRKSEQLGLPITLVRQDMRSLDLPQTFDVVTCFYDALNYVLYEEDLRTVFSRVFHHMNPGGLFVFDANTVSALRDVWGNNSFADDEGDIAYIWGNRYDPVTGFATLTATFFVKRPELGPGIYEKFTEVHVEKAYSIDDLCSMLKKSGFRPVRHYVHGKARPATEEDKRAVFVAAKPLDERQVEYSTARGSPIRCNMLLACNDPRD